VGPLFIASAAGARALHLSLLHGACESKERDMHIKRRGSRALLYRSVWVKKFAEDNTHGFSRQSFVGSMPVDATAVPDDVRSRVTSDELAFLHARLIAPARDAAEAARQADEHKKRDPIWRLEEASRLIADAAALSSTALVPQGRVKSVADALAGVKVLGAAGGRADVPRTDPLADALQALRAAARAVREGRYGKAPEEGVRRSKVYANWLEITREVEGTGEDGLLRELQRSGWVKAKGR
jgi:hypothetical protein